ncbi:hypothetical protein T492DRAFT_873670 [Pavlovales sp. CCMP2436]|nr:hypothetical protein T492DRAFT_873670 [Pavlovales sp. CCMP2436]
MTAEPRRHLNPSSEEDDDELDTPYANADARLNGLPPTARSSSFESHVSQPQPPIEEEDRDDGAGPLDPAAEAEDGSSALLNEEEEDSLPPMAQGGRFSSGSRSRGERRFGLGVLGGGNGGFKGELAGNSLPPTHGRKRSESVTIGSDMESFVRHSADVADAVQRFNGKPKDGLKFMRARKLLEPELAPSNEVMPTLMTWAIAT